MCSYILAVIALVSGQKAVPDAGPSKTSECLSALEVEGEAKGALATLLVNLAASDMDLKKLLTIRDELVSKLKKLQDTGEAPRSLEKTKKDLSDAKEAVLKQQVKLVDGLVPRDTFSTLQDAVKRPPNVRWAYRGRTKAEETTIAATYVGGLIQFIDNDYRALLKNAYELESGRLKTEEGLKLAEDPTDRQRLQAKHKQILGLIAASTKAATERRKALLHRLIDELNEGRGVPPITLHSVLGDR